MTNFVEVEVVTSESALREEAIAKLKAVLEEKGVVSWEENPADLAVITLSGAATMVPTVALIASVVPPAIFRKFGTELFKIAYNEGVAATVTTTWKFNEEGGEFAAHTIEAGWQVSIGEKAFQVKENVTVAKTEKEKNVTLVAAERGTEFNGLTGTAELVNALSWVKEVVIVGETSGGENQETDEAYQNRLAALLKLQALRVITANNFAEAALFIPASWTNSKGEEEKLPAGLVVGRATAIDGYNPATNEPEGKVTVSSKVMKEVTSYTGITKNTEIVGAGVPLGTLVAKAPTAGEEAAKELEMTAEATKTEAKQKYKFVGSFEQQRFTTVFVTNKKGLKLTSEEMEAVQDYLESQREINFKVEVLEPNYNEIQVKTQIHVEPGFAAATVEANVKKAIEAYLSPETYGNPTGQSTGSNSWLNITQGFQIVRYNDLIGVIKKVSGVQYVFAGSTGLSIGLKEAPGTKTADLPLVGAAPLTETKAANITVTSA